MIKHLAHKPQTNHDRERFGSLSERAEIWSAIFHPKDPSIIATCSEDQNVHIYSQVFQSPELI